MGLESERCQKKKEERNYLLRPGCYKYWLVVGSKLRLRYTGRYRTEGQGRFEAQL